jgi:glucose-6-phosphate isomerase
MQLSKPQLWDRFQRHYVEFPSLGLAIDISRVLFPDDYFAGMEPRMQRAYIAMAELEKGGVANPDEKRMVGHYWLRTPELAPTRRCKRKLRIL